MKKDDVRAVLDRIEDRYVDEAAAFMLRQEPGTPDRRVGTKPSPRRFRWGVAAATAALIAAVCSATLAFAGENRQYNAAVSFFEENGLSPAGLNRTEVKAVYRDITEKRFSYGKTAEVLRQTIPGIEILQAEPTPEELAAFWEENAAAEPGPQEGVSFQIDSEYVYDRQYGFEVFDKSILTCNLDGETLWRAEFSDFYIENYTHTADGTLVWGRNDIFSTEETWYAWIALADPQGAVKWQRRLEHGFRDEYVGAVIRNEDGTWAVISRGDWEYLCLSCYDADGNELSFRKTEVGDLGIWNAARLGDGYIVQLGSQLSGDTALLYRMDRDGYVTDSFSYEAEDCVYHITDMTEFAGRVWLSGYAVPVQNDDGGRYEIGDVLAYIFERGEIGILSEELTPLIRDNYTAVLLTCDPGSGTPEVFRSVKGSLGGKLSVESADRLEWDAESVTSTFFSPQTSSFTIGGVCRVYRYTFDADGTLIRQTDTGETVPYRR